MNAAVDAAGRWQRIQSRGVELWPGILLSGIIAIAAHFISDHQGGPTLLYALLLGMALHSVAQDTTARPGIDFTARTVLRFGVALLGARITMEQMGGIGWLHGLLIVFGVASTILLGAVLGKSMGLGRRFGVLTGGATAICGASAAVALAAVLPRSEKADRELIFTVAGITALSTLAMILYPVLVKALDLDAHQAGIFLGGTIHDVAQVAGAGISVSAEAGDIAVLTKMLRVALLLPVVLVVSFIWNQQRQPSGSGQEAPLVPTFLIAFAALVAINSLGLLPPEIVQTSSSLSRACLVTAIAAVGLKTSLLDMKKVGPRAMLLLCLEAAFLTLLVLSAQIAERYG